MLRERIDFHLIDSANKLTLTGFDIHKCLPQSNQIEKQAIVLPSSNSLLRRNQTDMKSDRIFPQYCYFVSSGYQIMLVAMLIAINAVRSGRLTNYVAFALKGLFLSLLPYYLLHVTVNGLDCLRSLLYSFTYFPSHRRRHLFLPPVCSKYLIY